MKISAGWTRLLRCAPRVFFLLLLPGLLPAPLLLGADFHSAQFDHLRLEIPGGPSYPLIHSLIQDRRGFIWIAGPNMIARYDGNSFFFFDREGDPGFLSDDRLFNIFEDSRDDIWVTSNRGLYLLDKEQGRFLNFRHDPADPRSLSSDRTRTICEDKNGALWIGTVGGGVNRMDPATRRFTRFLHDPSDRNSPGSDDVMSLCSAADGKIWMGAIRAGLDSYDPARGSWSHYPFEAEDPDGPANTRFLALQEGREGRIRFGCGRSGLFWLEPSTGRFSRLDLGEGQARWRDYRVFSFHEDRNGALWIGTENAGLYVLEPQKGAASRITAASDQAAGRGAGLTDNQVTSILEDREGLLWFGTANGVSILNKKRSRFPPVPTESGTDRGLAPGKVLSVFEDGNGVLWIGTDKGGLAAWERTAGTWTRASLNPAFSAEMKNVRVQAIAEDERGDLWVGTSAGLYRYHRRTGAFIRYLNPARDPALFPQSDITALLRGPSGSLWVGSMEGGFFEWDIDAGKALLFPDKLGSRFSNTRINAMLVDRSGTIWVGTQWRGVIRFDTETSGLSEYISRAGDSRSLAHNTVYTIAQDSKGRVWAGTEAGLCLYDPDGDNWIRLADDLGLPDRPIYAVVPDESGHLWMSSSENLIKVYSESRLKRIYGPEDGLRSGRFGEGVGIRCRNGEIVFGGSSGIDGFRPLDITDNEYLPPVAVSSLDVSSPPKTIPILDEKPEMIIPRSRFPVVVHVAALGFSDPPRQRYRAFMTNPEERELALGAGRTLQLSDLKPGRSTFVFYASNPDEVWNPEGRVLTVRVTVSFWQSWTARVILALLVASSSWLGIRRRRSWLKQRLLHQIERDLGSLPRQYNLTKREKEVLGLILQGKSNKKIETELYISGKTVKNHVYNLYQKLGVKSRLELANAVREYASKNRPPSA
jgi:ligand-binding sensor domain-containing protein/DNA-binding CsgD family transcriptional regulator